VGRLAWDTVISNGNPLRKDFSLTKRLESNPRRRQSSPRAVTAVYQGEQASTETVTEALAKEG